MLVELILDEKGWSWGMEHYKFCKCESVVSWFIIRLKLENDFIV